MLTPRMPLYIPCVYNGFMYWSTAGFLVPDHFVLLVSAVCPCASNIMEQDAAYRPKPCVIVLDSEVAAARVFRHARSSALAEASFAGTS